MTTSSQAIDLLTQIRDLLRQQVRPFDQRIDDLRKSNAAVDCSISSLLHALDNLEQRIEVGARLGIAHRDSSPTSSGDTGEGNGAPGSVTAGSGAPVTRAEHDALRAQLARLGERVERIGGAR